MDFLNVDIKDFEETRRTVEAALYRVYNAVEGINDFCGSGNCKYCETIRHNTETVICNLSMALEAIEELNLTKRTINEQARKILTENPDALSRAPYGGYCEVHMSEEEKRRDEELLKQALEEQPPLTSEQIAKMELIKKIEQERAQRLGAAYEPFTIRRVEKRSNAPEVEAANDEQPEMDNDTLIINGQRMGSFSEMGITAEEYYAQVMSEGKTA